MADELLRQSPLAGLGLAARAFAAQPPAPGVWLGEGVERGQVALRGNAGDAAFVSAVESAAGLAPPVEAGAVNAARGVQALWLGPDEWLLTVPLARRAKLLAALGEALSGQHAAAVDVSASRGVIALAGAHAREVLMKGCSLDLHPRALSAGQCRQSSLARCHVLIHQCTDDPAYEIYVHRSFMPYAWAWLEDAAGEYGVGIRAASA